MPSCSQHLSCKAFKASQVGFSASDPDSQCSKRNLSKIQIWPGHSLITSPLMAPCHLYIKSRLLSNIFKVSHDLHAFPTSLATHHILLCALGLVILRCQPPPGAHLAQSHSPALLLCQNTPPHLHVLRASFKIQWRLLFGEGFSNSSLGGLRVTWGIVSYLSRPPQHPLQSWPIVGSLYECHKS